MNPLSSRSISGGNHSVQGRAPTMEKTAGVRTIWRSPAHLSDAGCYDLVWASTIVSRAWQNLQNDFVAEGKAEWLEELRPFVAGGSVVPLNQEQAAARLGVPIATLRTWLSRLRQRYRESLRMEVADTVSDPADVDQELHHLYQILMA